MWIKTQWGTLENTDKFKTIAIDRNKDKFLVGGWDERGGVVFLAEYQTEEQAESARNYIFYQLKANKHAIEMLNPQ